MMKAGENKIPGSAGRIVIIGGAESGVGAAVLAVKKGLIVGASILACRD